MNFDLTEDQREIKRTARDFLAARYTPREDPRDRARRRADPHWDEIVELGWPDVAELRDRRARGRRRGARASRSRRRRWPRTGPPSCCTRSSRAAARSRCGTPTARRPDASDDGRTLTGAKIAVPNADVADTFVVTAEGGRHFAVAAPRRRRSSRPRALDPTRPLFTVRFDGAPGEELTGDHFGRAWHAIAVTPRPSPSASPPRVTRTTVEYAKERKQFGRPIGSYQAVSHACAQMFLETEGARTSPTGPPGRSTTTPRTPFMAANCAKAYASDAAVNVAAPRCRSTAGSASPGSTTCTCSSSAPRPTPTRSATPAGTASRSRTALLSANAGSGRRRAAWSRRRPSARRRRRAA